MDNFYITARRMWEDANTLYNNTTANSWFNTCYLTGYILECYGKLLIISSATGNPSDYRHRLDKINSKIQTDILINSTYAKYCLDLKAQCNTIYEGQNKWNPTKRYEDDPNLWSSQNIANNFINESNIIMNIIDNMKLDGVI